MIGLAPARVEVRHGTLAGALRRHRLPLLALAAAVLELLALRPVLLDTDAPVVWLDVVFSLVGGSFAAFGLVAWRRRPDSRSGALMTATGFLFFVPPAARPDRRAARRTRSGCSRRLVDLPVRRAAA